MSSRYCKIILASLLLQTALAVSVPNAQQNDDSLIEAAIATPTVFNFKGKVCHVRFSSIGSMGMAAFTNSLGVYGVTGSAHDSTPVSHHLTVPFDTNGMFGATIADHSSSARIALAAQVTCTDGTNKYQDRTIQAGTQWRNVDSKQRLSKSPLIVCPGISTATPVMRTSWMGSSDDKCGLPVSYMRQFGLLASSLTKQKLGSSKAADINICYVELAGTNQFWVDYEASGSAYSYSVNYTNVSPSNVHKIIFPYEAGKVITVGMTASYTRSIALAARVTCTDGKNTWTDLSGSANSLWKWRYVSDKTFDEEPRGKVLPCKNIKCGSKTCVDSPVSSGAAWIGGKDGDQICPLIKRTDRTHVFRFTMPDKLA